MTSSEIRQSFLDFFKSKRHTIVPSSSLMPDAPNLLFTNAGMNQFVPIFLGERAPDVDKWPGAIPGASTRAADTQKCIRAGGKHNDLEDVGLDTYHHTFFEMLGNWSFGDYFKKEAIEWAWELVAGVWRFPKGRLYATVFCPFIGEEGWEERWSHELDEAIKIGNQILKGVQPEFGQPAGEAINFTDREAASYWAAQLASVQLDPKEHIIAGSRKDNFWMMGETGPCGPCSELHVDLTPQGDTRGALVNKGSAECIEIWNLVFIQFNANPGGKFSPLPARHVDTGMGFERVTSIMQNTREFTDFTRVISNYETDIFRAIFDAIEKLSGKRYGSTLPAAGAVAQTEQEKVDIAFRVIADHIRTLSFAIADGILPGNTDRHYVLRRILRRAVRYGRTLGFHEPFFFKLVGVLVKTMGNVFPEIIQRQKHVEDVIRAEEEAFNKTLDRGIDIFESAVREIGSIKDFISSIPSSLMETRERLSSIPDSFPVSEDELESIEALFYSKVEAALFSTIVDPATAEAIRRSVSTLMRTRIRHLWAERIRRLSKEASDTFSDLKQSRNSPREFDFNRTKLLNKLGELECAVPSLVDSVNVIPGFLAFLLYDEQGFPLDLTELMARERGFDVDKMGFDELMDQQKARARAAQKKQVVSVSQVEVVSSTRFVGYDQLQATAKVIDTIGVKDRTAVILDTTPLYAEMGGQVGDTGELTRSGQLWRVVNTQKVGNAFLHFLQDQTTELTEGSEVQISVDSTRRAAIQRHHTVTHLLHWAIHEVVSPDASQKGSYVGPEKLTFDFNSAPLTPQQVADVEKLVNERILENAGVSWVEVPFREIKNRKEILQFFGEKYGDVVRVVQIGGKASELNGYSMELCGGTHSRATGELGLFRIVGESAIAAGVRRIEAVAGLQAYDITRADAQLIEQVASKVNSPVGELERKIEALLAQQKDLEKQLKALQQKEAASSAKHLAASASSINGVPVIIANMGDIESDILQGLVNELKGQFKGVVLLAGSAHNAVTLMASVSSEFTGKVQAGKLIQQLAPVVGGKGGGKPDSARGGGKDVSKLGEALEKAKSLLAGSQT
jgi:alanyl-tRNA synthetase